MHESPTLRSKTAKVVKKFAFAGAIALFLAFLGIFGEVGYHLYSIHGVSFGQSGAYGYPDAVFDCRLMYNPVIYPVYWLTGQGYINREFKIMYLPEAYSSDGVGGSVYFSRQQRESGYFCM